MYIKGSVSFFKIKNVILNIIGIFLIASSVFVLASLFSTYHDDMNTFWTARATPECIRNIIIGAILLVLAHRSGRNIGDAYFFSNYFELDLDGRITVRDLAESCGKNEKKLRRQMRRFHTWYMKGFKLDENNDIILDSKTCECECRSCGAPIEKSMYFAGMCNYCGGSDVFAKIVTDNRIYSISTDQSEDTGKAEYYLAKNIEQKRIMSIVWIGVGAAFILIVLMGIMDQGMHINDHAYLREKLLSGEGGSYELIKRDMIDLMLWFGMLILAMIPLITSGLGRISKIAIARKCSNIFASTASHFVIKKDLPAMNDPISRICQAIRKGYALNCSVECVEGEFRVSLARRILKDKCPYCGAHMVNVTNENYTCPYCNRQVMGVVERK